MTSKPDSAVSSELRSLISGLFSRGEEVVAVFLDEISGNPNVRDQIGKTFDRALDAKRRVDQTAQTVLAALNLPSRADFKQLVAKIDAVQGSLVNLNMKLDRLLADREEVRAALRRQGKPPE